MSSVFDFVNSVSQTKEDLLASSTHSPKDYIPFIVNRAMSNFVDTVMHANEMNQRHQLAPDQQYYYFLHAIRKGKRFSGKWSKPTQSDDIDAIKLYYGLNNQKALAAIALLSPEQVDEIKKRVHHGGEQGGKR